MKTDERNTTDNESENARRTTDGSQHGAVDASSAVAEHSPHAPRGLHGIASNIALPLVLIVAAIGLGAILLETPPEVAKSSPEKLAAVVSVQPLVANDVPVFIEAFGNVVPSREIRIIPEVSGRIVELNDKLIPGGLIEDGAPLFRIDPADYEIAVAQAEADLDVAKNEAARIRAGIEVLRGRGKQLDVEIAYLQWNADRLGKLAERNSAGQSESRDATTKLESQLAARKSLDAEIAEQQKAADAAMSQSRVAERRLESARLMLKRTTVSAPFDAIVVSESVEKGQLVGSSSSVAALAATDEFWAEASIPMSRLHDVRFAVEGSDNPSHVEIHMTTGDDDIVREGIALRPLGNLDPQGRMAQVLVSIRDPLGLAGETSAARRILLDSYVRLKIDAGVLKNVYSIPRKALRENDRIWVRDGGGDLAIRPVHVVWRRHDDVLVYNGFKNDDQLITSHLASVVPGMPLNIRADSADPIPTAASPGEPDTPSTSAAP